VIPLIHLLLSYCLAAPGFQTIETAPSYSESYSIFIKGMLAGKEDVTEHVDEDGNRVTESQHEIFLADGLETNRMAFITTMVLSKKDASLLRYSYKVTSGTSGDSYEVRAHGRNLVRTLRRGGRTSEGGQPLEPDIVIVDYNVYHHYDNLVRRYNMEQGGRQTFKNFLPLIATNLTVALTRLEDTNLEYSGGQIAVQNFKVEHVGLWAGTISIDENMRLVRLVARDLDLEVLRQDIVPEPPAQEEPPMPKSDAPPGLVR
jgi:hypothetical protein